MRFKLKKIEIISIVLFALSIVLTNISKMNPVFVQRIYTDGINKFTRIALSKISSLVSFSLGEIMVLAVIALILINSSRIIYCVLIREFGKVFAVLRNAAVAVLFVYSIFMLSWGFNYHGITMYEIENFDEEDYDIDSLLVLTEFLIEESNSLREQIADDGRVDKSTIIDEVYLEYPQISTEYNFLKGTYGKPKYILLSESFTYTGIVGVYFPFTGEANINRNDVNFMLPATILHEMAHQRGVAREDEANYLAFILSRKSQNPNIKYSGTLLGLIKSLNTIYKTDQDLHRELKGKLSGKVLDDFEHLNSHWEIYRGKTEETVEKMNDRYLKLNGQEQGVVSYNLMVDLLVKWHEKSN